MKGYGPDLKTVSKILVVGLGRIGDLVLKTSLLSPLKKHFPDAEIHFLTGRNNYAVLHDHPLIDKVHVHWKKPGQALKLLHELRGARYDLWIDPKDHLSRESRWFVKLAKPRASIGFNDGGGPFSFSIPNLYANQKLQHANRAVNALNPIGIDETQRTPVLYECAESRAVLDRFLAESQISDFCLLNVSANKIEREWPFENWVELLSRNIRYLPKVVCSAPEDEARAREMVARIDNAWYYPTPTIADVIPLVTSADFLMTVDTGIVHIASAFNTPIFAMYANVPLEYAKFHPLSTVQSVVISPTEAGPVSHIDVETASTALRRLESELAGARRRSV